MAQECNRHGENKGRKLYYSEKKKHLGKLTKIYREAFLDTTLVIDGTRNSTVLLCLAAGEFEVLHAI